MENTNLIVWVVFLGIAVIGVAILLVGRAQASERAQAMQPLPSRSVLTFSGMIRLAQSP